jgi:hypothetical protein
LEQLSINNPKTAGLPGRGRPAVLISGSGFKQELQGFGINRDNFILAYIQFL